MKIPLLFCAIAVIAPSATLAPKATFEQTEIDLGTITKSAHGQFKLTNTGDAPLEISNIHPDCGCTVASALSMTLAPGERTTIEVAFDPDTSPEAEVKKSIHVYTNDPSASTVVLTFRAKVVKDITLTPSNLVFDKIDRGDKREGDVTVTSSVGRNLKLTSVSTSDEDVWAKVRMNPDGKSVHFTLDSGAIPLDKPYGMIPVVLHIENSDGSNETAAAFYVSYGVRPAIFASPDTLTVKTIGQKFTFTLKHHTQKPFKVLQVSSPIGVVVNFDPLISKSEQTFQATVLPEAVQPLKGNLKSYIQVDTSDPEVPKIWIPVAMDLH